MRMRNVTGIMVAAITFGWLASCGDDEPSIPSAQELSESLIEADELDGDWTLLSGPQGGDEMVDPSGILTEEQRDLVPSFDMCDEASDEAREIAASLRPVVFRQLDLTVDDEIDPPFDRTGHMIFLQEFLYTGEPHEIAESFEVLRDGMVGCLGEIEAGEEGPGLAKELDVPEVGDDRLGVLITIEEAGGWAEWHIQELFVRDGSVLMKFVVVDIHAGVEPYFTTEEFAEFARLAADKL